MLITDKEKLVEFCTPYRFWQGIPAIERTKGGRIFSAFYSGGTTETLGNFALLIKSDDDGKSFSEPIAVAYKKEGRCYDQTLWIDPKGRLWFIWAYASIIDGSGVYAVICDNPDENELKFSEPFLIGQFIMMNKPTVLSSGEWLFPLAVWDSNIKMFALPPEDYGQEKQESGAFMYECIDHDKTFSKIGGVCVPERAFDEHMVVELSNGDLMMLVRTNYGLGVSYSKDKGKTWSVGEKSGIDNPSSRVFFAKLKSGRYLLVNHYNFSGRNNLTALLSEDDCKTFKYSLLLDERDNVSYPDAVETDDGYIYITYDRERGSNKKDKDSVMSCAREVLFAKITEEDIIAGKIVNENSKLKNIISKLGEYALEDPFVEK